MRANWTFKKKLRQDKDSRRTVTETPSEISIGFPCFFPISSKTGCIQKKRRNALIRKKNHLLQIQHIIRIRTKVTHMLLVVQDTLHVDRNELFVVRLGLLQHLLLCGRVQRHKKNKTRINQNYSCWLKNTHTRQYTDAVFQTSSPNSAFAQSSPQISALVFINSSGWVVLSIVLRTESQSEHLHPKKQCFFGQCGLLEMFIAIIFDPLVDSYGTQVFGKKKYIYFVRMQSNRNKKK